MVDSSGYGNRIREVIAGIAHQVIASGRGRRYGNADFARDVGIVERGQPYSAQALSEWLAERSEPTLATFIAMARIAGHHDASWIAFGAEHGRQGAGLPLPARAVTEPELLVPATPQETARVVREINGKRRTKKSG